jgi:hypothetical protein
MTVLEARRQGAVDTGMSAEEIVSPLEVRRPKEAIATAWKGYGKAPSEWVQPGAAPGLGHRPLAMIWLRKEMLWSARSCNDMT